MSEWTWRAVVPQPRGSKYLRPPGQQYCWIRGLRRVHCQGSVALATEAALEQCAFSGPKKHALAVGIRDLKYLYLDPLGMPFTIARTGLRRPDSGRMMTGARRPPGKTVRVQVPTCEVSTQNHHDS